MNERNQLRKIESFRLNMS